MTLQEPVTAPDPELGAQVDRRLRELYEAGSPPKSRVSGAILAVMPDDMGIAVHSPGLAHHGNSVRGVRVCKAMSARLGLPVSATEVEDVVTAPAASA